MRQNSYRIGNKNKSVKIKGYILEFYAKMMDVSLDEAKKKANDLLTESVERIGERFTNADLISEKLLVEIDLEKN